MEKVISLVNYRLILPKTIRLRTRTFYISLFEPAPPEVPVDEFIEVELEEYKIESILEYKGSGRKRRYLVKWENYLLEDNIWEPKKYLFPYAYKILEEYYWKQGAGLLIPISAKKGRDPADSNLRRY